ncbi:MAG: hypothetical protein AAGH89_07210, partial [Verrucomicrobiota bacterium]
KDWQQKVGARFPTTNPGYNAEAHDQSMATLREKSVPNREKQHAGFLDSDFKPRGGWWDQPKG